MHPVLHDTSTLDAFDLFRAAHPHAFAELEEAGYGFAGADVYGRCHGVATLFLELNPQAGWARGWVYDTAKNQFVGATFEVAGPLERALARARELIESTYAEDQLSGTAQRLREQQVEAVAVD